MTGQRAEGAGDARPTSVKGEFLLPVLEFNLPGTLDGGQAFRWHRLEDDDGYRGVVGRSVLEVQGIAHVLPYSVD